MRNDRLHGGAVLDLDHVPLLIPREHRHYAPASRPRRLYPAHAKQRNRHRRSVTAGADSIPADSDTSDPGPRANGDTILCEEIVPLACTGPSEAPHWLSSEEGEGLLAAEPERNLLPTAVEQQLDLLLPALPVFQAALASVADKRAEARHATHERVRTASRARAARGASRSRGRIAVEPALPVDVLGAWVLLPVRPSAAGASSN